MLEDEILSILGKIEEDGEPVTWRINSTQAPDPERPWSTSDEIPVEIPDVYVYIYPDEYLNRDTVNYRPETTVHQGHSTAIMGVYENFVPNMKDTFLRRGDVYSIVSIDPINKKGVDLVYIMGVEK